MKNIAYTLTIFCSLSFQTFTSDRPNITVSLNQPAVKMCLHGNASLCWNGL